MKNTVSNAQYLTRMAYIICLSIPLIPTIAEAQSRSLNAGVLCMRPGDAGKRYVVFKDRCPRGFVRVSKANIGVAGAAGATGGTGGTGAVGGTGGTGGTGVAGANGAAGTNGGTGGTGGTGASGVQGSAGIAGSNGGTGGTGAAGASGASGASGATGGTGGTGAAGASGATGGTGGTGATGALGGTGGIGSFGATGGTGGTGASGASGGTGGTGDVGGTGGTGASGATGGTGGTGDVGGTGGTGASGAAGGTGGTGPTGGTGAAGGSGGTGATGVDATAKNTFFKFFGSSAANNLLADAYYGADTYGASSAIQSVAILARQGCSSMKYRVQLSAAPGIGNLRRFRLAVGSFTTLEREADFCVISGASTSCSGTFNIAASSMGEVFEGEAVAVHHIVSGGSPVAARAKWVLECQPAPLT